MSKENYYKNKKANVGEFETGLNTLGRSNLRQQILLTVANPVIICIKSIRRPTDYQRV